LRAAYSCRSGSRKHERRGPAFDLCRMSGLQRLLRSSLRAALRRQLRCCNAL
jgi:hypothetical protein